MIDLDEDALAASIDMIGRCGAIDLEFGFQREDVPIDQADWYAQAKYRGTRIVVEHHTGPVEAVEALARRLLEGGLCTHCGGLVALSDRGALVHVGAMMLDGSTMTEERARSLHQCRYRRIGKRWVRGCEDRIPATHAGPGNRAQRRAAKRRKR